MMTIEEAIQKMENEGIKELEIDSPRDIEMAEVPERVLDVERQCVAYLVKVYPVKDRVREGDLRYLFVSEETMNSFLDKIGLEMKEKDISGMYV